MRNAHPITSAALILLVAFTSATAYGQESTYESADQWNYPNDNYWVCGKFKNGTAPTRYSDGSLVNGGIGYDVKHDAGTEECGSGFVRFDLHEIIEFRDGEKTKRLAFHKGGQGYTPHQLPYGHILLDDIEILDGVPQPTGTWNNVPLHGSQGAGLPQVQGQPPEYGAPSWDPDAGKWDATKRNGRGCTPTEETIYAVKVIPQGSPNELSPDWQYKPNATSSRFNKYADAGPEFGDKSAHYAYLMWSWLFRGDGITKNGGGGMMRSLLRDGQELQRCPVKAINSVAYAKSSDRIIGEVTAIYVKTRASQSGPWLYGWMISAHRAKLPDGAFGPRVDHISMSTQKSANAGPDQTAF